MSAADILRAARAKIADPKHWTQGNFAHDEIGEPVAPTSPLAVCWCAVGAIDAVGLANGGTIAISHLADAVKEKTGCVIIGDFNDCCEHAEVLAAFDRAIQLAEGRP